MLSVARSRGRRKPLRWAQERSGLEPRAQPLLVAGKRYEMDYDTTFKKKTL